MKYLKRCFSVLLALALLVQVGYMADVNAEGNEVTSKVIEVQKYGNLVMEAKPKALYDAGFELGDILNVKVGNQVFEVPFCTSYSDVETGNLLVRDDKKDNILIVAINMGNFSKTYSVGVGDELSFSLKQKEGYLAEYLLRQLNRTNNRNDYALDSVFANFRNISTSGIKPGVLYRSSSPINNNISRATFANDLAEAVGIKTIVNLADTNEMIEGYKNDYGFKSDYYMSVYEAGNSIALNMGIDLKDPGFEEKTVEALKYIAKTEAPYLVHCDEGKDRAGFVSAVLEAVMGASIDEIVEDYMLSFENYYNVERGSEQYKAIADSNIVNSMTTIVCGLEKGADLSGVDLAAATEKYLLGKGMTNDEIKMLREKLSVDSVFATPKVSGSILEIEKYGHASTDILIEDFEKLGFKYGDTVTVVFDNGFVLEAPYLDGYYVENGNPLVRAYPGHTNIAVCINYGKLFKVADLEVGDTLTIMMSKVDGYKTQYEIRKLERTNERDDYASDAIFANFRNLTMGDIAANLIYRSANPISNELGRAAYADKLMGEAGVVTVVNLADSKEEVDEYLKAEDFNSPNYKKLYDEEKVIYLDMNIAYKSDDFKQGIAEGMKFIASNEGPYLFHCTEGKDRAGFFAAILGALMGATKEEIVEDYMISYDNFYGVKKGTPKYEIITGDVISMLEYVTGSEDLSVENLKKGAESYLTSVGMTAEEIEGVRAKLSGKAAEKPEVKPEAPAKPSAKTYTVKAGDCLWKISQKVLGDKTRYLEIYKLNKDKLKNPHLIYVGQVLVLPE